MKSFLLSIIAAVCLFACCDSAKACPPIVIDQPVQVQSFGGVQSFGAVQSFAFVQPQLIQTFAFAQPQLIQTQFVGVRQRSVVVQRGVGCGLGGCNSGLNVRVFGGGGGRGVVRQRSVQRFR